MNSANPTALRIGMQGSLDGRRHTVLGRVVLGMELDGETYYWNEFYLGDDAGGTLTLVFEETESGPTWKLFRLFEPAQPLTGREAAGKRPGERLNFDGMSLRITLVDQTRVYYIEGDAPEGVALGDVADYFNAEAADRTVVVSWTGDEIEFYEGRDLPAGRVETAFSLPERSAAGASAFTGGYNRKVGSGVNTTAWIGAVLVILALVVGMFSCRPDGRSASRPAVVEVSAPAPVPTVRLGENARGRLAGRTYVAAGHALVGIARLGGRFVRHEYDLLDEGGGHVLLVNGLGGHAREWHLLAPVEPPVDFTPFEAAALRQGKPAQIAGRPVQVTQLFQFLVLATDGQAAATVWPARLQYGLLARVKDDWLISRWSETGIQFYEGKALAEREVLDALGPVKETPIETYQKK